MSYHALPIISVFVSYAAISNKAKLLLLLVSLTTLTTFFFFSDVVLLCCPGWSAVV